MVSKSVSAVPSKLQTSKGNTTIADSVVQKIAGVSAREVSGVYALGGGAARTIGALRERIPGSSQSVGQGVAVEVGERQAAIDLDIVTEYGVSIVDLSRAVRRNVIEAVEGMTGLEVTEVNVVGERHPPAHRRRPSKRNRTSGRVTGSRACLRRKPSTSTRWQRPRSTCPAVAGLHPGGTKFVATYLPGRRVVGVRVEDDRVLLSVVLARGASVRGSRSRSATRWRRWSRVARSTSTSPMWTRARKRLRRHGRGPSMNRVPTVPSGGRRPTTSTAAVDGN